MTTLAALADKAQNLLSDSGAATWAQATIEEWCNLAIADYSNHFPRKTTATITTVADDRQYDLPTDFRDMLLVEYPTGQDPPEYLSRMSHQHPDFWINDYWYDVVLRENVSDPAELWIGKKPAADETITYTYFANHDHALAAGGTVTVPTEHENILIAFVFWKAGLELLSAEQQAPTSNSSLLMGQLASNADRAKRAYFQLIAQALQAREADSALIHWKNKRTDLNEIY